MTEPFLTLDRVTFAWPDGQRLFADINAQFDARHTGLVGRNGVGKSVLARILAGQLAPTAGRCVRAGRVHYVAQQIVATRGATLAMVAGVAPVINALARIEAGAVDPVDFDTVGDRWDIRQRLMASLDDHGLGHLDLQQPAAQLSGGELTRVSLLGAWLADPDVLVLDEPSDHLDRTQREHLLGMLQAWPKGLLVISHDRELLDSMQRIVELAPSGLRDYGGGDAFYAQTRAQEQARAAQELQHCKAEQRRGEAQLRAQRDGLARRQSRDARRGRDANQARILLGDMKQRSHSSAGRLQRQHDARSCELMQDVRDAAQQIEDLADIALVTPHPEAPAQRKAVTLENVELPFGIAVGHRLDLTVLGRQRIGVVGANGSGKSTLARALAGSLQPRQGCCIVHVPAAVLDQQLGSLYVQTSPLGHLLEANPASSEAELRGKLALLGLAGDAALKSTGELSGGERLKAALAAALYRAEPAQLLVLDEPTNHLDLPSLHALEQMLLQYRGPLVVMSHDRVFLDRIGLDSRLEIRADGWLLVPW